MLSSLLPHSPPPETYLTPPTDPLRPVVPKADRRFLREPFEILDPTQYRDPWPLNDLGVMQNVFVRILPNRNARYPLQSTDLLFAGT